jgi:aryl-alcohol dehydrogenase-like predicted oxidoreductase
MGGSKWGYRYVADWQSQAKVHEVKEHTLSLLREQLAESRESLGDYLGLYQIHSVQMIDPESQHPNKSH